MARWSRVALMRTGRQVIAARECCCEKAFSTRAVQVAPTRIELSRSADCRRDSDKHRLQ